MGMFDWYQPAGELRCPECGTALKEWQGKDGPCAVLEWQEGKKAPVNLPVDAKIAPALDAFELPPTFLIYSYDCPNHQPIEAVGTSRNGVWCSTELQPFRPKKG